MKYIKYFETLEEYESWMNIEENAEEVIAEDKLSVSEVAALEEEEELPVLEVVAQEAEIDEVSGG